jgi:hypothetical protein
LLFVNRNIFTGRSRSVEEQEEEEEGQSGQQLSSTTAQEENEEQEEEENEEIDEAVRQWRAGGPEARLPDVFDYNANHSADFLDNKMTELLYDFRSSKINYLQKKAIFSRLTIFFWFA